MSESEDKSDSYLRSILKCVRCGTCRSVCPVFEETGWESSGARGRMLVAHGISQGMDIDSDVQTSINTCTTCGLCEQNCPSGAKPPDVVEETRHQLVLKNRITDKQAKLRDNVNRYGNTLAETSGRYSWLGEEPADFKEHAEYVFFVGCLEAYRYPEVAKATFDILKKFDVTLLPDEYCCGSPLLRTGFEADDVIDKNIEQIKKIGAHTVITGCAGCYTTFKNDYPHEFEVKHVVEFLAEHIDELDMKPLDITVAYHDPCHIGRKHGIYEAPRKIIKAICNLKEMKTIREDARCCGGGGGVLSGYPELSHSIAEKRMAEVPEGVDYVVTSCPLCRRNLSQGNKNIPVIDIVELVALAMK